MQNLAYNDIKRILPMFQFTGRYQFSEELLAGNVNNTYHLVFSHKGTPVQYTLQHINSYVFKDPEAVMRNISMVTNYLKGEYAALGEDPLRRVLQIIPTKDGKALYRDEHGGFWRAYYYIDNVRAYDQIENPELFMETGRAFGEFQRMLCHFPADELTETIPNFHNTLKRFYAFVASVDADRAGRAKELEPEIEFFFEHRRMMGEIVRMTETGVLPLRVTHNDTKVNNVLLDTGTGKAVCVIDLDTVMPGSALYDYGDAIRFGASTAVEDEPDLDKIGLNMELFEMFTQGFLSEVNGFLTPEEIRLLPLGIKVITCELGMRFLTDYIDGDLYFKVRSPEHNLTRARAQMKLLTDIEAKYDQMLEYVANLTR